MKVGLMLSYEHIIYIYMSAQTQKFPVIFNKNLNMLLLVLHWLNMLLLVLHWLNMLILVLHWLNMYINLMFSKYKLS